MGKSSQQFRFLNKNFFNSTCETKSQVVQEQTRILRRHDAWGGTAENAVEHLAASASCFHPKAFLTEVCAFQEIFDSNESIQSFLKHRTLEEWCLLYYEIYFWNSSNGRKYLPELVKKDLFQEDICVFLKSCQMFCNPKRNLPDRAILRRLEFLFGLLKMTQISLRQSKEAFTKNILSMLKIKISETAYFYLEYCLHVIEAESWKGNWYISDESLFAHDLLVHYEEEVKIDLLQWKEEVHADFIFVLTLYYLIQGELTNWFSIHDIPFAQNVKEFQQFKKRTIAKKN